MERIKKKEKKPFINNVTEKEKNSLVQTCLIYGN